MTNTDFSDLPEDVRPHAEAVMALDRELGIENCEPWLVRILAWRRWVGTRSNEELGNTLMHLRRRLCGDEDNILSVELEEAAMRLKRGTPKSRKSKR